MPRAIRARILPFPLDARADPRDRVSAVPGGMDRVARANLPRMDAHPLDPRAARLGLVAGISGFIAVAAGAFGAHALKARLDPAMLAVFETGARYHLVHALGMLAAAWAVDRTGRPLAARAGWLFGLGTVLFSGSLYALALTGIGVLGAVTPFGGVCFLAGWLMLGAALARR
jgi:uncharacterized membrane protein YgdD (TMEM256/DUF423 family)